MVDNILNTVTHRCAQHLTLHVLFVLLKGNSVGDEGATALAGALVHLEGLTEFYLQGPCVPRLYALVIVSDSTTSPVSGRCGCGG